MTIISKLVEHNFSRHPEYYNDSALTQQEAAEKLASLIAAKTDREKIAGILEIGCGTGFLTKEIMDILPDSDFTITDISAGMLDYCREALKILKKTKNCKYSINDITNGCPEGIFDLITSSLTFQWIENIETLFKDLHSHLSDNGQLIFTTLAEGTFADIEKIFDKHRVHFPIPPLAGIGDIQKSLSCFSDVEIIEETYIEKYSSIRDFLDHIHKMGAGNATGNRITVSELREIIKEEKKSGEVIAEYKVVFAVCRKGNLGTG